MSGAAPETRVTGKHWLYLFAGFSLVATVAIMAAILGVYFYLTRPLDLAAHTDYLSDELVGALKQSFLPEDAIRLERAETREAAGVTWDHHVFNVQVPEHLDVDGLKKLLQRAFVKHYVTVEDDEEAQGANRVLRFTLSEYEFASVVLLGAQPAAVAALLDIRPQAAQLARDVERALADVGLADDAVSGGEREEMVDASTYWALTSYQLSLPEDVGVNAILAAIDARLSDPEASAYLARMSRRENIVMVAYGGKDVVTLTTVPQGDAPAALLETMMPEGEGAPDLNEQIADTLPYAEHLPLDSVDAPSIPEGEPAAVTELDLPEAPQVAIILDDGGYGGPVTEAILALDNRLTLAILPNTPHGARTAEAGAEKGFEIMLHMPMETTSTSVSPFPGQLETSMARAEILTHTLDALGQIPHVVGANNHTGSKYTGDAMRMEMFLEILKEKDLFFIDSFTQPQSRGYDVARSLDVPSNRRDVFLDNESDHEAIRAQFEKLIALAKKRGAAIGIAHFRGQTAKSLAELLPKLEAEGVVLVHASELVS